MATNSRENPWYVLVETDKGQRFYSSYATKEEADADAKELGGHYSTVSKADGDISCPDMAVPEPPADKFPLGVIAADDGHLLVKVDKEFVASRVSDEDAKKIRSLKTGESLTIGADPKDIQQISEGLK